MATDEIIEGSLNLETTSPFDSRHLSRRVSDLECRDGSRCEVPGAEGFTKEYDVTRLVYFECFEDIDAAIHREKRLKKWTRGWKIALIEKDNPNWIDLYPEIAGK